MDLNDIAPTVAAGAGLIAATIAILNLRASRKAHEVSARSAMLSAVIATNDLWKEATTYAKDNPVELSAVTVAAIRQALEHVGPPVRSALDTGEQATVLVAQVPYVCGALLASSTRQQATAPSEEADYRECLRARTMTFGYVRTVLEGGPRPPWLSEADRAVVLRDFQALDAAMQQWVNHMNEVAEFYETELADQRMFVGKRSAAIVRQLYAAEPYILWRNSTTTGRWGLRVLGLGIEARNYHWRSRLQHAALQLAGNPAGYGRSATYPGFCGELGWIIGPGRIKDHWYSRRWSEFRIARTVGRSAKLRSKTRQSRFVATLPRSAESGLSGPALTWAEVSIDPTYVHAAITRWNS